MCEVLCQVKEFSNVEDTHSVCQHEAHSLMEEKHLEGKCTNKHIITVVICWKGKFISISSQLSQNAV